MSADTDARATLESDFAMMRRQGVKLYRHEQGGAFTVEFFPAEPAQEKAPAKQVDVELCACGHHKHIAHTNGLCVEGCSEEQCNPKSEVK